MSKTNEVGELIDLYFELREDTESPYIFHRWSFVTSIAAALGRNLYMRFGDQVIYPNTYTVLLGSAGSRKSTAISQAASLLKLAGYNKFAGDKTSPEKFISDLASGFDTMGDEELGDLNIYMDNKASTKDVLIKASELEDFLGPSNGQFISLLTNLWDNPADYQHRTQTRESAKVVNPTINLLGGATPVTFQTIFPAGIIGQGMLSRMIIVHGAKPRKRVPFPSTPPAEIEEVIVKELERILSMEGEVKLTEDAHRTYARLYTEFEEIDDERLESYSSRRHTHLLKLCIILAAMNGRYEVTTEDLIYGNSMLTYTERFMSRALGEFGSTDESKKMTSLLRLVRKHEDGINMKNLAIGATEIGISLQSLGVLLTSLVHLKKVDRIEFEGENRVIATKSKIQNDSKFCDFNLLKEFTSTNGAELTEEPQEEVSFDFTNTRGNKNDTDDDLILQ